MPTYTEVGRFVFDGNDTWPQFVGSAPIKEAGNYRASVAAGDFVGNGKVVNIVFGGFNVAALSLDGGGSLDPIFTLSQEEVNAATLNNQFMTAAQHMAWFACEIIIEREDAAVVEPDLTYRFYFPSIGLSAVDLQSGFTFYNSAGDIIQPVNWSGIYDNGLLYIEFTDELASYTTTRTDVPALVVYIVVVQPVAGGGTELVNVVDGTIFNPAAPSGGVGTYFVRPAPLGNASANLILRASATLNSVRVSAAQISISGRATLLLSAIARLFTRKMLKAKSALRMNAGQGIALPPTGLGAVMQTAFNPSEPDTPDQYLQIWFNGNPNHHQITLQLDNEVEFTPAFIWQNPGVFDKAVVKVDIEEIPGDGATHVITIRVRQSLNGRTSAAAVTTVTARIPSEKPPQPLQINAVLLRQATEDKPDLVEVSWTATSGVIISANLRPQTWPVGVDPTTLPGKTVRLGYGNESESTMLFEGIGARFEFATGNEQSVFFSVAEIRNNEVGHPLFTVNPLRIRAYKGKPIEPMTPDEIAGTARKMGHNSLRIEGAQAGVSGYDATIAGVAFDRMWVRIKDIVAKGGNVTVDNFGTFEARWSASKLTKGPAGTSYTKPGERGIGFAPSPGFKEGTERGRIMTDAEVKALL